MHAWFVSREVVDRMHHRCWRQIFPPTPFRKLAWTYPVPIGSTNI